MLVNIFGHASQVSWLRLHWLSVLLLRCGARLLGRLHGKLHRHHARIGVFHWIASRIDRYGLRAVHGLCDALDEQRRALQVAPAVVFVIASLAVYAFMPSGNTHLFVFYGMRTLYLLWIMVYIAVRYMGRTDALRERMWRHRIGYAGVLVLGAAVLIENVLFLFYIDPVLVESGAVPFFPERNFAENALMLWMAAFIGASCYKLLSIHFVKPPAEAEGRVGAFINAGLAGYAQHYGLSARETEVLRMVLEGKDNQSIAGELSLAASTVKVHVHNILKKTAQANRQELMRDFRKMS